MGAFNFFASMAMFAIIIWLLSVLSANLRKLRLPKERPLEAVREWSKVTIPFLAFLAASVAAAYASWQFDLATEQARLSSRNLQLQSRAYVYNDRTDIDGIKPNSAPTVRVFLYNYGQTPARNVSHAGHIAYAPKGTAFPEYDATEFPVRQTGIMGPKNSFIQLLTLQMCLSQDQYEEIEKDKAAIFVYGRVEYDDMFGVHHRHNYRRLFGRESLRTNLATMSEAGDDDD